MGRLLPHAYTRHRTTQRRRGRPIDQLKGQPTDPAFRVDPELAVERGGLLERPETIMAAIDATLASAQAQGAHNQTRMAEPTLPHRRTLLPAAAGGTLRGETSAAYTRHRVTQRSSAAAVDQLKGPSHLRPAFSIYLRIPPKPRSNACSSACCTPGGTKSACSTSNSGSRASWPLPTSPTGCCGSCARACTGPRPPGTSAGSGQRAAGRTRLRRLARTTLTREAAGRRPADPGVAD